MSLQVVLAFLIQATPQKGSFVEEIANILVQKYIEGGFFMHPILAILIIGLGLSIAKWISLSKASINTRKFLNEVKKALDEGGVEKALEVCQKTPGPVASIFQAGLLRANEGIEAAEKAIIAYGGVEMAFLERGLVWLSLFISLAPLLGFTGTVQGMIVAFDSIKEAKNISPEIVAGGISIALLTTLFGLVVAMILQTFYNYFVAKVDRIVVDMEESSIELIDALAAMQAGKKVTASEVKNPSK
jgi:biopolymer transport protein ExbB